MLRNEGTLGKASVKIMVVIKSAKAATNDLRDKHIRNGRVEVQSPAYLSGWTENTFGQPMNLDEKARFLP
jgi:hypothetical protein